MDFAGSADPRLLAAFPPDLASTVRAVAATLPPPLHRTEQAFTVVVGDAIVAIPYRLCHVEPQLGSGSSVGSQEAVVLACLLSRNHDGHVRHRAVEHLLARTEDWVVPFVVKLIGEYVVEIMETIWDALGADLAAPRSARRDAYQRFVRANPDFIQLTHARVTSYWACYYRGSFPDRDGRPNRADYPGYRLIDGLRALA